MVDEISNKIKSVWAFNPAELKEDVLTTLVGRDREISDLIQWLKINKGSIPEKHRLFHGPRGIGKTILLLAVYYTILKTPNLLKAFLPITFSEDSSLLTNEANFIKAVYDFLSQNTEKLEITKEFHQHKWASSLDSLIEFSNTLNRPFVFLLDNFQAFLGSVLEGRGGRRDATQRTQFLKKLLSTPEFLIIACSLKRPERIRNKKEVPFWERFEKEQLSELKDFSEASSLLFKRAELEGKDFFSRNFPKLSGRIRAIFALSEGNPRYLVLLYQILRKEQFENLQVDFCSILDGLTGVLDAEIDRQLSPRQKPVLKALCQCGGRGTVKDVIREYFLPDFKPDVKQEKEIGNDLSSLTETDFVEVDKEARGRLKVYQITPPLFQLWFEMRHLGRSHHVILLEIFEKFYKLPFEDVSAAYRALIGDIHLIPETVSLRAPDFLLYSHLAEKGSENLLDLMEVTRSITDSKKKDDYINLVHEYEKQYHSMGNREKELQNKFIQVYDKFLSKKFEEAEEKAKKLLDEIKGLDTPFIEACTLWLLSAIRRERKNPKAALETCEKALNVSQKLELPYKQRLLGDIHYTQGKAYELQGSHEQAISYFERALEYHRKAEMMREQALDFASIGASFGNRGDHERAAQYFKESLEVWYQLNDKKGILPCLFNFSLALVFSGKLDKAIEKWNNTIELSREIGEKKTEAVALLDLGATLLEKGDYERSIKESEKALAMSREIGDKKTEADSLVNLGAALGKNRDYEGSIKATEEAIALSRETGYKKTEADALRNLGKALRDKGDYDRSIKASEEAIALSRGVGDKGTESNALLNLGAALIYKSDYKRSIEASEMAISVSREIEDKKTELKALGNLVEALRRKGDYEGSIKASEETVALSREVGDKGTESNALLNLGAALIYKGDYKRSIEASEMAISVSREIRDKKIEVDSLFNLGEALRRKGDYEGSIKASEEAIALSREIGDKGIEKDALKNLFLARVENSRELVIFSKPARAVQEIESAHDSLGGFDSPNEYIPVLHISLFIPLLSKGFFKESLLLKETVDRWKVKELIDYLTILNVVIKEFLEPDKKSISSLPPIDRSLAYEIYRQAKGKKTLSFAIVLIYQHKYPEALEILEGLYKDTPDDLQVVRNARNAAIMAKQLSKAEIYCKIALDLGKRAPVDVGYWGVFLKEKGDIESAEKELSEAISKGSDEFFQYGVLVNIYDKQKRFSEASDILQKALKNLKLNYNKQVDVRLDLCEYKIMMNKTEEAFKTFEQIDFEKIAPPQKTIYLFLKYLLSCIRSDQVVASNSLKEFCDHLIERGEKARATYDFTNLIQYATDNLGEKQITLLRRWADAVKGLMTMSEFVQIYGTEEQREKAAKEWNDERSLAIHRLKSGKIKSLDDIQKLSTGSNPIETSLDAYSYFYNDLPKDLQTLSRGLIIEGLYCKNPTVNKTAAQSAGTLFWNFSPKEGNKALSGMLSIAQQSEAPADLRDAALSVIAALFFRLEPSQQDKIIPVLRKVKKEYSPVYLKQLISRIDHKEEEKS